MQQETVRNNNKFGSFLNSTLVAIVKVGKDLHVTRFDPENGLIFNVF